ncbi:hypothetical protein AMC79_CH03491 [Rhizobium phaseoli]|nr:hypothetical protein AMC79_CH03491 [Rhizobium phaseoli]
MLGPLPAGGRANRAYHALLPDIPAIRSTTDQEESRRPLSCRQPTQRRASPLRRGERCGTLGNLRIRFAGGAPGAIERRHLPAALPRGPLPDKGENVLFQVSIITMRRRPHSSPHPGRTGRDGDFLVGRPPRKRPLRTADRQDRPLHYHPRPAAIKEVGDVVSWRGFAVARVRRMNQICCDAHWKSKPVSPAVVKARFIFLTSPDRLRFGLAAGDEKLVPRCR